MILEIVVSMLTLYFALSLGVSGLTKIDNPLIPVGGGWVLDIVFSPVTTRAIAVFEIMLAFILAFGVEVDVMVVVNAVLAGLFLAFKVGLWATRQGSLCGCFGAHELMAVDVPSLISSALILALAVVLAVFALNSAGNPFHWFVAIVFLTSFAGITFRMLGRWKWRQRGSKLSRIST